MILTLTGETPRQVRFVEHGIVALRRFPSDLGNGSSFSDIKRSMDRAWRNAALK